MKCYQGKVAYIDLSSGKIEAKEISEDYLLGFIGGTGLAARLIFDLVDPKVDPLSPKNVLVFMTGALTGTMMITSARMTVAAKSPLTRGWGEAHAGGFWGVELKKAGYDGVIIIGKAERPTYIYIHDEDIELKDASKLWGLDTYEADVELKKVLGDNVKTAVIGPAGEKLVSLAGIIFDARPDGPRVAGRTGMGAVMGSKNLKAIAVKGSGKVEVADPVRLREYLRRIIPSIMSFPTTQLYATYGTAAEVAPLYSYGDLPIKNFSLGVWDGVKNLEADAVAKSIVKGHRACFNCPIGCWRYIECEVDGEKVVGRAIEYESLGALGSLLMIDDPAKVAKLHQLCNKLGIDVISAGVTVAWLIEAYEKGLIDKERLDGLELKWGDHRIVEKLLKLMAEKKGIGELLAKGVREASKNVKGSEAFAMHSKGLEIPMHDPRAFKGMGLQYATSNRGACHLYGFVLRIEQGERMTDLGIHERVHRFDIKGKGRIVAIMQDWSEVIESMGICKFLQVTPGHVASIYSLAVGRKFTAKDLHAKGTLIFNLKRIFNLACGMSKEDDSLPDRLLKEPLSEGGAAGQIVELDSMLKEYYEYRGWNEEGYPRKETLEKLGLLKMLEESKFEAYKEVLRKVV
ncbi:MAG: aldehyde ferredoxin oxidoreductase family protein [Thaumarchaeota archaeon]|nr:aldehyde ferredoxin oxidoreductase family protein [Nitrososphaerota archaeon]